MTWEQYLGFLKAMVLSAAIGMLIGVEREHSRPRRRVAGFRTFTLAGILGCLTTRAAASGLEGLATGLTVGTIGLVLLLHVARTYRGRSLGLVTPMALLIAYAAGGLVGAGRPREGATLAVITTAVLLSRSRIHPVLRRLSDRDVLDAMAVFALAAVAYPICPPGPVDPWGVLNLRSVIEVVLAVLAVTAVGYVGMRLSPRGGALATALVGGFVSSSATTATVSSRFGDVPRVVAAVVPAASAVAVIRNAAYVGMVSGEPTVLKWVLSVALPSAAAGFASAVFGLRGLDVDEENLWEVVKGRIRSPLAMGPAVKLGLMISGFAVALKLAQKLAGGSGVAVGVVLGALASSNAMSLTLAYMAASGALDPGEAGFLAAVASLEAVSVKVLWVYVFGGSRVFSEVWPYLLPQVVAGGAGLALRGYRYDCHNDSGFVWWARRDLNPGPPARKAGVLPG